MRGIGIVLTPLFILMFVLFLCSPVGNINATEGGIILTFDEVIKLARSKGYTFAITGSGTYDICEFAKNFKDEKNRNLQN